ncbi:iron-sulfur cluster transfer protein NUBPL isoform X5 [Paramormyrops kingsleyae]|uniref:iron-sulfur cluster transfer protein NUBPL isoform X5 n=1 Tax=Paramormyrops kingsleyae TaxID=1676925 RepID=UPI003B97A0BF
MDNLTITTTTHVQARWILKTLGALASWVRMVFKPRKSRSLVIRRGKLTNAFKLYVQGEQIPTIRENPIKCLGKWYDDTLSDRNNISDTGKQADEWLRRIDGSGLPGKFNSWIYQHGLLPRLMWPLTVYEIPVTAVEKLEKRTNKHLRQWLGIPPSFTAVGLYIRSGQLQLPFSSVVEKFKVAKCRVAMILRDSKDKRDSNAGIITRTGRKWVGDTAVRQAESSMELRDIIGNVCTGWQGLGTSRLIQWGKGTVQQRRQMVQVEVRHQMEETRKAKAVDLASQGTWTRWDLPKRRVTWTEIWRLEPFRVSFLLRLKPTERLHLQWCVACQSIPAEHDRWTD